MGDQATNALVAIVLGTVLAVLLLIPTAAVQYRRDGRLVGVDLEAIRRQVETTIEHLRSVMGEEAWVAGMNPDVPETALVENPYQYTDYVSDAPRGPVESA